MDNYCLLLMLQQQVEVDYVELSTGYDDDDEVDVVIKRQSLPSVTTTTMMMMQ